MHTARDRPSKQIILKICLIVTFLVEYGWHYT